MCEMIKYKGNTIKIGTCENLYYATYADLKDNADYLEPVGGNAVVEDYLNENTVFATVSRSPTKSRVSDAIPFMNGDSS